MTDLEVGRYALRTFHVPYGSTQLDSVAQTTYGSWLGGVCEAVCTKYAHTAPQEHCTCGIYGMLSIQQLFRQYSNNARYSVAVISVEGTTFIGEKGLRTEAARVVAYWCAQMGDQSHHWQAYSHQCPDADIYSDLNTMLTAYGFDPAEPRDIDTIRHLRAPRPPVLPEKIFKADVLDWAEFDRRQALKKPHA
jgi:hypothetical protein